MTPRDIAQYRLSAQHIAQADFETAGEVVRHMGAMQAQDYAGALWSIGLRMKQPSLAAVEQAIAERQIVRTWPMRGTLHFVAAEDIRWMVNLLGPRMTQATAGRRRQLELDDMTLAKAKKVLVAALEGGTSLGRTELCAILDRNGIATAGQRGIHILRYYSEKALLCYGPHQGKEPTFVLLDEWLPDAVDKPRDEALTELARRYFTSHGPATIQDFAGWGFMAMGDAKAGLAAVESELKSETVEGKTYYFASDIKLATKSTVFLLPGFDEYMLGYKDRSAALPAEHSQKIVPGNNGMFLPTIIIDGQVVGTWKRSVKKDSVSIALSPFRKLTTAENQEILRIGETYGRFLDLTFVP